MAFRIDISDIESVADKLEGSPVFSRAMEPVFKQAVTDFQEDAQDEAPRKTGKLSRSIKTFFGVDQSAEVGTIDSQVKYAKFVWNGTKAHKVAPKNKKALRFVVAGGFAFSRGHIIPAKAPNRYLEKTYRKHEPEYTKTIENGATAIIQRKMTP